MLYVCCYCVVSPFGYFPLYSQSDFVVEVNCIYDSNGLQADAQIFPENIERLQGNIFPW